MGGGHGNAARFADCLRGGRVHSYSKIVSSREFERAYPGIKRSDGTLIVNPGEYGRLRTQYRSIGAEYSLALDDKHVGQIINLELSADEFQQRARAVQQLRTNPQLYSFLRQNVGVKSVREGTDFLLGKTSREFDDRYEQALLQATGQAAGEKLTSQEALGIARRTGGILAEADIEKAFQEIRATKDLAGPELRSFGVTDVDLRDVQFGGPRAIKAKEKIVRAVRQREAALENAPAQQRSGLTQEGRPIVAGAREPGY